jgi:ASC-1-like (ASCH) protein
MEAPKIFVQSPWMEKIAEGRKPVEGRNGPVSKWEKHINNNITWYNEKCEVLTRVIAVRHYDNLDDYF